MNSRRITRRKVSSPSRMDPGALPPQLNDGEATLAALQRSLHAADQRRLDMARRLHRDVAGNLVACSALSEMVRSQLGAANGNAADMAATLGELMPQSA